MKNLKMKSTTSPNYEANRFIFLHQCVKNYPQNILVFRTDIKTKKRVKAVESIFNSNPTITNWFIDTMDIDNVLRIEAPARLNENEIINQVKELGFFCEPLID